MSITIVIEVHDTRDSFEDTKACLRAMLAKLEMATPAHPLPREDKLQHVPHGPKLGAYAVYFPMKSHSVMDLIKLTHDGTDLTPISTQHA